MKRELMNLSSILLLALAGPALANEVQVAVAANFMVPMKAIAAVFEKDTGHKTTLAFGTVGKFYAQLHNGAPFEVLVASDEETPAKLVKEGMALSDTRSVYAIGKLVLWSAKSGFVDVGGEVLKKGDFEHLALANPNHGSPRDHPVEGLQTPHHPATRRSGDRPEERALVQLRAQAR